MSKYFTPFPEDIRIGYECEVLEEFRKRNDSEKYGYEEIWLPRTVKSYTLQDTLDELSRGSVRVPYLTKNQIRNQGWEYNAEEPYKIYKYDNYMRDGWKFNYSPEYKALILTSYNFKELSYSPCFRGQCKDINDFRTICKFLGI